MYKFAKKAANHEGFTLVELIVVIAILGILAGIAIPVYSGYIKKANQAADNMLLSAVNTAFAAACIENDPARQGLPDTASAEITDGKLTKVTPYGEVATDSFWTYFGDNKNTAFKVYTTLQYDKERGFYGDGSGDGSGTSNSTSTLSNGWSMTITNDGTTTTYTITKEDGTVLTYTASNADVANVTASTFGDGHMTMGELTTDVSTVVGAATKALGGNTDTLRNILGEDTLTALGLGEDATADQLGNALVLMVAQNTNQDTANAIMAAATEGEELEVDLNDMGGALSKIAAMYGMVTGYANSEIGSSRTITVDGETMTVKDYYAQASQGLSNASSGSNGIGLVMNMMNNIMADTEGTAAYMSSGQAEKDLAGYISAMAVIAGNADTLVNGSDVLNNGFSDNDLISILDGIFNP